MRALTETSAVEPSARLGPPKSNRSAELATGATPSNGTAAPLRGLRRWADGAATLLDRCGVLKLQFQQQRALRILCYHGVCDDELLGEPWLPSYFVGAREFARQMEIVARFGPVRPLAEVVARLAEGEPVEESTVAITFDDVAACSFTHARPILASFGFSASFYIATNNVSTGRLFNADVLRLLRWRPETIAADRHESVAQLAADPGQHKRMTLEQLSRALDAPERALRAQLDGPILDTLRSLNWDEVQQLARGGHEIGSHTADHVILGPQGLDIRRRQLRDSVTEIENRLRWRPVGFAYPNGGPGDFGPTDATLLRALGLQYAVTTRAGFATGADLFALPRVCIGAGHTPAGFAMELSGLLDGRRQRQQGWS